MKNVVILSLPRSGSSILANLLRSAGFDVDGRGTKALMRPNANFNPDGYFERIDVVKRNDKIMQVWGNGANFLNPRPTVASFLSETDILLEKEIVEFQAEQYKFAPWVLKDARFCFTLHHYKYLQQQKIIVLEREPSEIKESMVRHYGNIFELPPGQSLRQGPHEIFGISFEELHSTYKECIIKQCVHENVLRVNYSQILSGNLSDLEDFIAAKVDRSLIKQKISNV